MAVEMFRGPDHMAMRIGCMISQDSSAAEQFANAEFWTPESPRLVRSEYQTAFNPPN